MSILNYFSRKNTLLNPNGSLSSKVPPRAIIAANREIELVQSAARTPTTSFYKRKRKFAKNNVYDDKLRAEMGKDACKMGPTAAAWKYSAKLSTKINESTMRGIKRAYLEARGRQDDDEPVTTLPPKKRGRSLLLGKTLDVAVHEYILKL